MKIVPQLFFDNPNVKTLMFNGKSCIFYKESKEVDYSRERYVSMHTLSIIISGQKRIETTNGGYQVINENEMIFIPRGLYMISDIIPKSIPFMSFVFCFEDEIIEAFSSRFSLQKNNRTNKTYQKFKYSNNVKLYVESLISMYPPDNNPDKNHRGIIKNKLTELLYLISISNEKAPFFELLASVANRERSNLKKFMAENFDKPLDIKDYAYLTGRSISTFQRDFKFHYHSSPKQWLIEKRLEKAKHLLATSDKTVSQIVSEVGFKNIPHFIKSFQKKYENSPKQFQLQKRKNRIA